MISDKSLKRAIKTAVKHGGCNVWFDDIRGNVNFWYDDWCVVTDHLNMRDHLREVMGYIVEMLGYIPQRPVKICKANSEYIEIGMLAEVAEAEVNGFLGGGLERVARLPLHWRGHALWMSERGRIYGIDDGAPSCMCKVNYINGNGCITAVDEDADEGVYIRCFDKDHREGREWDEIRHLETFEWFELPKEEMDQMELEDEDE